MSTTQQQSQPTPQEKTVRPPSHAYTYRIGDYSGNDATDFFDSDFHLDNSVSTNIKFKPSTPGSSFKLTLKTRPTSDTTSTTTEGTFVFPISEEWSSNGHPISTEMKFKPKGYSFNFSYTPFLLAGTQHWLNPYFTLNIPSKYTDINKDSTFAVGTVLHQKGSCIESTTNSQVAVSREGEHFRFQSTTNNVVTWRNFILSSVTEMGFKSGEQFSKSNRFCIGASWPSIWANLIFHQSGDDTSNVGLGLKHEVNDKFAVAVQRWQELTSEGLGASTFDIGFEYFHCPGFQTKFVLNNMQTLGFWANFVPGHRRFSASICYDRNLKGADFNWGTKINFNL